VKLWKEEGSGAIGWGKGRGNSTLPTNLPLPLWSDEFLGWEKGRVSRRGERWMRGVAQQAKGAKGKMGGRG
jgi:hypothetical protein